MNTTRRVIQKVNEKHLDYLISSLPDLNAEREIRQVLRRIRAIKKYNRIYTKLWRALQIAQEAI